MGLDEIVIKGERWLDLTRFSKLSGVQRKRLKSKIMKSGKNSIIKFKRKKMNLRWYIPESEIELFSEEAEVLKSGEYYSMAEVSKIIKGTYHNSKGCWALSQWISKGYMNDAALRPKTSREAFIKKEWVHEFARTNKYRIIEAARMLGIDKDTLYSRMRLPENDERRLRSERFPNGMPYLTEQEISRQRKLIKNKIRKGDYASAGAGYSGKIEKIIKCNDYDAELKLCKGCKPKERIRYVINGTDYCRRIVEKF